jgi:hypothetical protein
VRQLVAALFFGAGFAKQSAIKLTHSKEMDSKSIMGNLSLLLLALLIALQFSPALDEQRKSQVPDLDEAVLSHLIQKIRQGSAPS